MKSIFPFIVALDAWRPADRHFNVFIDGERAKDVTSVHALWNGGPGFVGKAWRDANGLLRPDDRGSIYSIVVFRWRVRVEPIEARPRTGDAA